MAVYGDADAMKWVGDGNPLTETACQEWLNVTNRNYAKYGYGMFAVALKSESTVIGFCGIVHPGGQKEAETKYAYLRGFWGQGIASEALAGLIAHGIKTHSIRRMIATTSPENIASHRVLLKAGMVRGDLCTNEDGSLTQIFEYTA
jgi:RimJ/RimL family protein N-acetyltransferase